MGTQLRTSGHEKAQIGAHQCPKVLGKPIYEDKSSPRYRVDVGTYSFREMSFESKRPKVGFALLGRASFDAHQLLEWLNFVIY